VSDRGALGDFLRSRRDRLTPAQAGIDPFPGPRRVPGLRREELAWLAGLSAHHYGRIEQGRQRTLSPDVAAALARALCLDEVEAAHLAELGAPPARRVAQWEQPTRPEPGLLRLMTAVEHLPALLLDRSGDVLEANPLVRAVLGTPLLPGSSFLRWLLTSPDARRRIVNWPDFAAAAVGGLRLQLGRRPGDQQLRSLIDELRAAEPAVARWWDDQRVTDRTSLTKEIDHPEVGRLVFGVEAAAAPHNADQRLVVYTVEPGSPTARILPLLASWAASSDAKAGPPGGSAPTGGAPSSPSTVSPASPSPRRRAPMTGSPSVR
jgi:PAS domain-containing protein